ncbi:hypothetical protein HN51_048207 [Arachis hypogaea]
MDKFVFVVHYDLVIVFYWPGNTSVGIKLQWTIVMYYGAFFLAYSYSVWLKTDAMFSEDYRPPKKRRLFRV